MANWDMQKFDDPEPIVTTKRRPLISIPLREWIDLPRNFPTVTDELVDSLDRRISRRDFGQLEQQQISSLLWFTQRETRYSTVNPTQSFVPVPTAGGLASVRTIVVSNEGSAWIYDPRTHRAGSLLVSPTVIEKIVREANLFFETGDGSILLYFADRAVLERHYRNPESLVLREAGAIIGVMAVISEALGLAFCALGTQASIWICALLGAPEEAVIPGGAAVVGSR